MDQELKNQSPLTSAVQWQETAKAVIIWSDFHTTAAGKLASFEHIFWSPNVENTTMERKVNIADSARLDISETTVE